MSGLSIFLYEWKHFIRSPFKVVALLLFIIAAVYGLHNGSSLYRTQVAEIENIQQKATAEQEIYLALYDEGKLAPEGRPWVDMSAPLWAIWYTPAYSFKTPSPAMVYSTGQTEQYGFYKKANLGASPYDADMAEEIANPERLQTGTLDFSFVLLFLLPLLLLILLYNLKSAEAEQGFLPLIEVQTGSKTSWLLFRMAFYLALSFVVLISLLLYGAILTNVFASASNAPLQMLFYTLLYVGLWSIAYFIILKNGTSILGNTLQMVGVWLLFAFIIPATVHQVVSILRPVNLMTDLIDADRDKSEALMSQPDSVLLEKLNVLYPQIAQSPSYPDSTQRSAAKNQSTVALLNELKKESIDQIEKDNRAKNELISHTFWFNPVSFFQNKLNSITATHYQDYQAYRNRIQTLIDKRIEALVLDTWNEVKVDKAKYINYNKTLSGAK